MDQQDRLVEIVALGGQVEIGKRQAVGDEILHGVRFTARPRS
jgi:hypothetical protein